jgi:hypothetical protein
MIRAGAAGVLLLVAVSSGCARSLPPRVDPPPKGEPAEVGVAYGVEVYCPIPIELGGMWWTWDEPMSDWPEDISIPPFPFSIWATVAIPYAVPGIVTLTDVGSAVFRADVDGSEFTLSAHDENPTPGNACL